MKTSKYLNYIYIGLMILIGTVLIWRAFYGVNYNDEMYYAACLNRLYCGDAYLVQAWQIDIMSLIPVYPFYLLFRLITGSNEGLILFLRILYVGFQLCVSLVCFLRLKHKGWVSLFVSLIYLLFTPFNIAVMSYNTMALGFAMLTFALLIGPHRHPSRDFIFCGITFACFILANPFAIFLYLLYAASCLIHTILHKKGRVQELEELSLFSLLWITAGAFLVFLIFVFMLFRRASLWELYHTFRFNLQVPGHEQNPAQWSQKFTGYFERIYEAFPYLIWCTGLSCLISVFDKKRVKHALWYLLPVTALVIYYLYRFGLTQYHVPTNFCVMPLAFLEFLCFWLMPKKKSLYFWLWFVPGMLYSLCSHFASDTGILCITSAFILCSSIGIVFLWDCFGTLAGGLRSAGHYPEKAAAGCIAAALLFHICIAGYLRITFFYQEASLPELTEQVTVGPAKGLYTTPSMAGFHMERVNGLKSLSLDSKDNLLVIGTEPWAYLCTDAGFAGYDCWWNFDEWCYLYYLTVFPEKEPTVVYCTDYENSLQNLPYLQRLLDQGYQEFPLESAMILRKP